MSREMRIKMGLNLGYIEKIVLTDGTVVENMQVLYRAPIPNKEQLSAILSAASKQSEEFIGCATREWSAYPKTSQHMDEATKEVLA